MAKFLHKFDTDVQFESAYTGDTYEEPWVSYTVETREVNFNYKPTITIKSAGALDESYNPIWLEGRSFNLTKYDDGEETYWYTNLTCEDFWSCLAPGLQVFGRFSNHMAVFKYYNTGAHTDGDNVSLKDQVSYESSLESTACENLDNINYGVRNHESDYGYDSETHVLYIYNPDLVDGEIGFQWSATK